MAGLESTNKHFLFFFFFKKKESQLRQKKIKVPVYILKSMTMSTSAL